MKVPVWPVAEDGSIKRMVKPDSLQIEYRDPETGGTPLVLAALHGSLECLECLIAYGANVDVRFDQHNTNSIAQERDSKRQRRRVFKER